MKKILLIIALALCIFQLVVLATAIDIGSAAIDRGSWTDFGATVITKNNPANLSGKITSIEIWANTNMTGVEVATFYVVSGNNFSTRDNEAIPGTITAGSKVTKTVDLDVEAGDYIGLYWTGGRFEFDESGGSGRWRLVGDYIPCTDVNFGTPNDVYAYSLYGTGETPAGITWNGITITKWNGITITIPLNTQ